MAMPDDPLAFKRNGELREEIVYAVGGDPTRYGIESRKGMTVDHVRRVGHRLQPDDSDVDVDALALTDLYTHVCDWAGGDHEPNAGKDWKITRENLKKIHRAVGGEDPREVPDPGGASA